MGPRDLIPVAQTGVNGSRLGMGRALVSWRAQCVRPYLNSVEEILPILRPWF